MKKMNGGIAIAVLSLALIGAEGCANLQPPRPAPASAPAAPEFHAEIFRGMVMSIYHPETRTLYVWYPDPRIVGHPMSCTETHISTNPLDPPTMADCPKS